MMETTQAIVLKTAPYSETTLLVTLLTEERGVVRALAKGARRKGHGVAAAYEPLAWIETQLRQKSPDGLGTMFNAELREGWPWLRQDLDRFAYAGLGVEVIGELAASSPPEPAFFHEAVAFLQALGEAPGPGSLTIALLLRLLHRAGFPPQLAEDWTAETLPATLTYHFDRGTLESSRPGDPLRAMRLPGAAVAPLLDSIRQPREDGAIKIGAAAGAQALRWLIKVWEDHLNVQLHAARFLEKMVLASA